MNRSRGTAGLLLLCSVAIGATCGGGKIVAPLVSEICDAGLRTYSVALYPTWAPDGHTIAVLGGELKQHGFYIVDVRDGTARLILTNYEQATGFWMDFSPDGNRLLMFRAGDLWILDLRDNSWRRVTSDPERSVTWGKWSPGGDSVFYWRSRFNFEPFTMGGLYVTNLVSGAVSRFNTADGLALWPDEAISISPDGQWITYASSVLTAAGFDNSAQEVYVTRMDGTERRRVTYLGGTVQNPQWIHGGKEIEFDYRPAACDTVRNPYSHTWSVRPDGGGLTRWSHDLGDPRVQFGLPPAIDRTGEWAAFIALGSQGKGSLFVSRVDGSARRQLFPAPGAP